ncbi:hypothetical protein HBB16_03780 [Pseudonocardia sp. MCCB 268]|nr:hypothetical protein [Pseudonocardia cytotoxica]
MERGPTLSMLADDRTLWAWIEHPRRSSGSRPAPRRGSRGRKVDCGSRSAPRHRTDRVSWLAPGALRARAVAETADAELRS